MMESEGNIAERASAGKAEHLFKSFGVLLAGCLMLFLQSGSFKACGVLFDDIVRQYETSYLYGGWVLTLQQSACLITAGIASALLPKISNRSVGVIGGILFGLGFVMQGLFGQTLCHLFLFTGMSAAGIGFLYFAAYMAYVEHFPDCFPLAFSVREVFIYVGIIFMPLLLELLRGKYGLHGAFLIFGAIASNGIIAGVLLKPHKKANLIDTNEHENLNDPTHSSNNEKDCQAEADGFFPREYSLMSLLCISSLKNHPLFILFNILHALLSCNYAVWAVFLVPYGLSLGYAPDVAVFLSTFGGFGGLFGKLVVIALFYYRQTNQITVNIIPVLVYGIAMVGYVLCSGYILLLISSFLSGFSLAFVGAVTCAILPNYVCRHHLRQGFVVFYVGSGLAAQLGGISAGAILDVTSSFSTVFVVMFVFNAVIAILIFIMGKQKGQF